MLITAISRWYYTGYSDPCFRGDAHQVKTCSFTRSCQKVADPGRFSQLSAYGVKMER